jgi:hypothetical protein
LNFPIIGFFSQIFNLEFVLLLLFIHIQQVLCQTIKSVSN